MPTLSNVGWFFQVFIAPVLALALISASASAQTLPNATQLFTGYAKNADLTMRSPDGFFILTSGDNAVLSADQYGAYFNNSGNSHGASGRVEWMEIRVNPQSNLGSFRLASMVAGSYSASAAAVDYRAIRVSGYLDDVLIGQTPVYNTTTRTTNWPLNYSSFLGTKINRIRIEYTVHTGTNRSDFNLLSFTIADAQVPLVKATVSTAAAATVTSSSALLGGNVTSEGDSSVTQRGIVWSTSTGPSLSNGTTVAMGEGSGSFSATVTGLPANRQIYVRAFAVSAAGTSYGSEVTFSTPALPMPGTIVLTAPANAATGVSLRPQLSWTADAESQTYAVELYKTADPSNKIVDLSGVTGTTHQVGVDLAPTTAYTWRVRGANANGTGSWSAASFTTMAAGPTVVTGAVSAVTSSGATVAGDVTAAGGSAVSARGVVYGTSANPTLADGVATSGSGTGAFDADLSGLAPGTTYYARAYATNDAGTTYGTQVSFTTSAVAPTVVTGAVSGVTSNSATVAGNVSATGGATVTARGLAYSTSANPTLADNVVASGAGAGAFSQTLASLQPGTTYHVRAYATNSVATGYGDDVTFTTPAALPTVVTGAVSAVTSSGATVAGDVSASGGATVSARGVVYGTTTNPTLANGVATSGSGTGVFTAALSGLAPGTTHYVRAYATNSAGTSYGSEATFTTSAIVPTVVTGAVSAVTSTGATVAGNVSATGGAAVSARGVVYATTANPTLADAAVASGSGAGAFSAAITGLAPATTYHVRAYATNSVGTSYGDDETFTTSAVVPTVATGAVSAVTSSGATIAGDVSASGGATVSARGVVYGTTTNPTLANGVVTSGSGTGTFSAKVAGLQPGTTYYVRAYATNSAGTSYGSEASFTTSAIAPTVATGAVTLVTSTGATVAGDVSATGGAAVSARGVVYATTANPTLADAAVASGSGAGTFGAAITGLAPGTTYHVRAYATNSVGTSYGNDAAFTTDRLAQAITFAPLQNGVYGDTSVVLTATASSGLAVSLVSSDASVARVDAGRLVIAGAGSVTITATQSGNGTYGPASPVAHTIVIAQRPVSGAFTIQNPKTYDGTTAAQVVSRTLQGVLAADQGQVALTGGSASFADANVGSGKVVTLTGATLSGARSAHYALTGVATTIGAIQPGLPAGVRIQGAATATAGVAVEFTLTLVDAFGHPTTTPAALDFTLTSSLGADAGAFAPAAVRFSPGGSTATFAYIPTKATNSPETISVNPASPGNPGLTARAALLVEAGPIDHFEIELDQATATRGARVDSVVAIRVIAQDAFGNQVTSFNGVASATSSPALKSGGGITGRFVEGVLERHELVFGTVGATTITISAHVGGREIQGTSPRFEVRYEEARLSIELVSDNDRPALGSEITLRVIVTNIGWAVAGDVVIDPPLAGQDRLEVLAASVDTGAVDSSGDWKIDQLASGAKATMTIRARVLKP